MPRLGRMLTINEAAKRLQLSPRTIQRMIRANVLRTVQIGHSRRIVARDLEAIAAGKRGQISL